jgi:hypothetical protein
MLTSKETSDRTLRFPKAWDTPCTETATGITDILSPDFSGTHPCLIKRCSVLCQAPLFMGSGLFLSKKYGKYRAKQQNYPLTVTGKREKIQHRAYRGRMIFLTWRSRPLTLRTNSSGWSPFPVTAHFLKKTTLGIHKTKFTKQLARTPDVV